MTFKPPVVPRGEPSVLMQYLVNFSNAVIGFSRGVVMKDTGAGYITLISPSDKVFRVKVDDAGVLYTEEVDSTS